MRAIGLLFGTAFLAGCIDQSPPPPAEGAMSSFEVNDALVHFDAVGLSESLIIPDDLTGEIHGNPIVYHLSGPQGERPSTGHTGGAYLRLDSSIEEQVAGRLIEVIIHARSQEGTHLNAAYSTNDNGNSGWQTLVFGSDFSSQSFQYQVPRTLNGNDDFLGLTPVSGSVEIADIAIRLASPPPALRE